MFKVIASNLDGYFGFDPSREGELRTVDGIIRHGAPGLQRWFVAGTPAGKPGMSMSMIGYGRFTYQVRSSDQPINWPILGLALQKNHLSLYISARRDGSSIVSGYAGRLGKVSVSKTGAIRFVYATDVNAPVFSEMLETIQADFEAQRLDLRYERIAGNRL